MADPNLQVRMECKFERGPAGLKLGYALTNQSAVDVGALLWIPAIQPDHSSVFTPDSAYIELDGSTLHVRKMMLPLPKGTQVAERPIPFVSIIKAGQKLMQVMKLPVPVPVNHPFRQAALGLRNPGADILPAEPRSADALVLSIGIFAVAPNMKVIPVQADLGVMRCWPFPTAQQVLTWQTPLAPPLHVLDYRPVARSVR
jgi:hypothetical protein